MRFVRTLVIVLCLAAILAAALTPGAPALLFALLVPLWFFAGEFIALWFAEPENDEALSVCFLTPFSGRAPPAL